MFAEWRCLSVFGEVLDVAATVETVDVDELWSEIRSGRPRSDVFDQFDLSSTGRIAGSPTFVLPDGSGYHNPGIEMRWSEGPGSELIIDRDDPSAVVELIERAVALATSD
jgi:hypothetical protein